MAVATKRSADPSTVTKDTQDHVLVSWSAQGGIKQVVITRAEGSWLYAGERRILDFSSGLINVNLGHGHPKVVRAIQEQAERVCYVTPSFGEVEKALAHVEEVIWYEGPEYIAAILVEPIPGTSGVLVPPDGYLRGLRALCDKYGILLMFDEVMTGFGRTGKWFGADHEGVVPDVLTFAKGVTSGYVPLGGAIVTEKVAHHFDNNVLWVGSTYSGHPLACAAGVASIEAYREDGLIDRSARMGEKLLVELNRVADRHPSVGDVRGRGLFAGIELVKDRRSKEMLERWNGPSSALANALKAALLQRDVYVFCRWNMLFVAPPLPVTDEELVIGVRAIDEALEIADRYAATGKI